MISTLEFETFGDQLRLGNQDDWRSGYEDRINQGIMRTGGDQDDTS